MSIGVAVTVPDGIVMATDSRVNINVTLSNDNAESKEVKTFQLLHSDQYKKMFVLRNNIIQPSNSIAVSFHGNLMPTKIPLGQLIDKFESEFLGTDDTVPVAAEKLLSYLKPLIGKENTGFLISGYSEVDGFPTPFVYQGRPADDFLEIKNRDKNDSIQYSATWVGTTDIMSHLFLDHYMRDSKGNYTLVKKPTVLWPMMPLQDAVDFAVLSVFVTKEMLRFQTVPKSVGGPVNVIIMLPDGSVDCVEKGESNAYPWERE